MTNVDYSWHYLPPPTGIVAGSVTVEINGRRVPRIARRVNPRRGTVVISPVVFFILRRLPPKPVELEPWPW